MAVKLITKYAGWLARTAPSLSRVSSTSCRKFLSSFRVSTRTIVTANDESVVPWSNGGQGINLKHRRGVHLEPPLVSSSRHGHAETAARRAVISVETTTDGSVAMVNGLSEEPLRFHAVWLRHNCQCSRCRQPHSGQKLIESSELHPSYRIRSIGMESRDVVQVVWHEEEEHRSTFPVEFLQEHSYSGSNLRHWQTASVPSGCSDGHVPRINYTRLFASDGILTFLQLINEFGICLVEEVPVEDQMVKKTTERIWPVQRTIYGDTWDVKSDPEPINVAYSDAKLGFHMDLAYYESPPGIQFLHCVQFDDCVVGGESQFVDAWHVAEAMRSSHPEEFETLTMVPATFQKIHYNRENPVHMLYQRPHIIVKPGGTIVALTWAPAFEGPLQVPETYVESYYRAHRTFAKLLESSSTKLEFRLVPGDMVAFNNRRILHARNKFQLNGGMRHLQGCYLNIDEFKSCLEVRSRDAKSPLPVKHVFNNSWF